MFTLTVIGMQANYRHSIQLLYCLVIHCSLSHSTQSKGGMNTEQNPAYGMTASTHISEDTKGGVYEIPESIQPQPTNQEEGVYEGVY